MSAWRSPWSACAVSFPLAPEHPHRPHRTLLTYVSSLCCLNIPVFFVSSTSFIRSDDPRIFVRHGRHIFTSIQPPRRPYFHHSSRFALSQLPPVYYGTPYISRKTHASHFSRTNHSVPLLPTRSDHIYPLRSKPEECGPRGEILLPFFGCL